MNGKPRGAQERPGGTLQRSEGRNRVQATEGDESGPCGTVRLIGILYDSRELTSTAALGSRKGVLRSPSLPLRSILSIWWPNADPSRRNGTASLYNPFTSGELPVTKNGSAKPYIITRQDKPGNAGLRAPPSAGSLEDGFLLGIRDASLFSHGRTVSPSHSGRVRSSQAIWPISH